MMDTNIVLLIVSVLLLIGSLFAYFGYLKISNELYVRVVSGIENEEKPDSPYSIKRTHVSSETYCYEIYNNDIKIVTQYFFNRVDAIHSMNELELLEGYKLTRVQ